MFVEAAKSGLDTVQSGRNYLDTLANRYVVKPKTVKGIAGFVFDYEGDTSVSLQAEITDHYAEDNTSIQDHIALKPVRLTLRGFVGELVLLKPQGLLGALDFLQNKLTTVPAYLGKYTPQALGKVQGAITQAQNTINKIDQGLARVKNIVGMFDKSGPGATKQAKAYAQLETLFISKQIFLVETPYRTFDRMAIETLTFLQDENTKSWSDISVTLKQLRLVEVKSVTASSSDFGGRAAAQRSNLSNQGNTKGSFVPVSVLSEGLDFAMGKKS